MKEVMEWEVVNFMKDDKEPQTKIAIPKNMKTSAQEDFVQSALDWYVFEESIVDPLTWQVVVVEHSAEASSIIKDLFDDANKVITQNSQWDIIPDYAARAKLKIEILKSMWIIKNKQVEVKVNFLNLLFGKG